MPRSVEAEASHFGYRRKVAPQAARTSSRSDGAAACLSPERQPPVASTSGAQSEHRRYERGHVQEVTRIDKTRSPRATRSPDRDLHASDELARVLSPEALHSSSPPRTGPVQRRHYHGLAAQCPEPVVGERPAGGSTSNDHVFTRFHSGETGVDRPASPPGRRRLSPTPRRDGTTTKQAGALLPHFVGEKVAETADGWAAYREARPGGGVEVSWRRTVTPAHTEQHAAGTAFNASHTSVTLAQVVSGTGDGCISSFNVGAPKWAKAGNGDTARLQMSSFSKHRVGEASEPDSGSPRSVFARRRAAAEELEYDDWHRLQSRQTKAGVRRPPPTPQQWLQQKIQEAKTIPAVASILEPRELEEFMHQVAESTIDELEVHNHEFSDKIRRGNVVPQELKAWQFLQNFAQGCIQREVAKLDIIARAKTGSGPQLPQTPLALRIDGIDAAFAMDTPEQQRDMPTPVPEEQGRTASTVGETRLPQPSEQVEIAEVPGKTTRKEMFERMDVSSTGKLTLEQIQNGIEQSYPQLNHRAALLRAYKAADVNGDGLIGRREFRLLLEYLVFFSQSWQEFEAFAHGDNYRLSKSEFVACCEKLGLLVAKEAGEEFHVVDKNGGGYVLFEEFCCWAGIHKIGQTKQLWPKYKIEMDPFEPDLAVEQTEPRRLNRHARVISPDKGGRLSKPNRVWVNNKWQDSPQTTAMPGVDRATDRLSSPPRSTRLFSPVRTLDAADSTGASLLISPERQKPSHLLTSPERRTLRNRESALQDPGSSDEGGGVDASLEVSLTGVWRATGERRDGTKVQQGIYIRHEQDGRVTGGHVDGVNGFFVIKDGTVDGSTVWFRQEYSNGNRVVWEATIEQTYVSGIMVPKLVDGTWKGSNLQGSFTASLETMRLTPAEATGSGVATSRRKKKTAVLAGTTASAKQPVSSRADLDNVDAVTVPPEAPAQSESSLPHDEDLSGTWIALGFTSHGTQEREQFVLKHDVSSGGIHGHSVQEDDEDSFEIIDGVLEGRSIKFVQKFHDGLETLWCVPASRSITHASTNCTALKGLLTPVCARVYIGRHLCSTMLQEHAPVWRADRGGTCWMATMAR